MISAETAKDGNTIKVTFDGETSRQAMELTHIVTKGVTVISDELHDSNIEATLYALMMTAIEDLNEEGHKIDHKLSGFAMMMAPKPATADK